MLNKIKLTQINPESLIPSWLVEAMKATEQNPRYHAEGNVWNHSLKVLQACEDHHEQFGLDGSELEMMRWACLLHDIGKPAVTCWKVNRWVSHGHEDAGLPFARNILLDSPLNSKQRQQVLNLIKYHSLPLSWRKHPRIEHLFRHLAVQTDLRLLGAFFYFDIMGRDCVGKDALLAYCEELNQHILPKIQYEWGTYDDIQQAYAKAPIQHKNALWNSLKFKDTRLTGKLLKAAPPSVKIPDFQVYFTVSLPASSKAVFLEKNYSYCKPFALEGLNLSQATPHQRENYLRQAKHFISVWGRGKQHILITGEMLDETMRTYLGNFCRSLGGELSYLLFEERDAEFDNYTLPKSKDFLDVLHPWEAHRMEYIQL